tara:strand:- start:12 stop:521 length:510 start_codon:yes stop_codon:yes gene_type:complete
MKNLTTLFISIIFTLIPLIEISAQSKVAHINTQELISEMPEVIAAQKELKKLEEQYAKELESSAREFQTKAQTYAGDVQNQTELINKQRQSELEGMQQRIQEFRDSASQELQKRSAEMMKPLYDKARKAIEKVASAQGFDYVLDSSTGGSVIMAKGKNLSAEVKQELGF